MEWKILNLRAINGEVKEVQYLATLTENGLSVQSEGYCYFDDFGGVPFDQLTENQVIGWVAEKMTSVEPMLRNQIQNYGMQSVALPWTPPTFSVQI